ncbi:polysaccharide biosynthesis protein [Pseudogulbenkiania subflava]|uniref:NDP-sugar epimerase, includes UDP-GlcNAc-inverting 4,6-dehydratase FlaA1 and capsular polysaccharide biosynthesis protein EpsC n=1 Tax=Pseudogulbenkiania subflava DSM 22618 TaxID=1123014 RepID=A0A1Y6CB73_9NEIS|nr:nucleoside-diphosphate sugar epimerase/dehydratase [Pseudogulbenkiania subflava]SMF54377.1 NDP-sugar epimerase, includes UDP-GlcNAc-inverting 4,6-dehydratase FlaA1 and capsular polysaccharide biosynthesis protein EpsC [Pseudogulbenkiania subflava DSM 22618]
MIDKLLSFSRHHKMALLMLMDALLLPLALYSAVVLRLGGVWDPKLTPYLWIFVVPPLWVIPIFIKLGLYRAVLKYLDDKIVYTVCYGVSLAVLVLAAVIVMARIGPFPRSSIVIFWVFAMAYIGGSRFLLRGLVRRIDAVDSPREHVIIYGAGRAGIQLMLALQAGREYRPMAFVDDNPALWRHTFRGLAVHAPAELPSLLADTEAKAILLALPSVSRARQREILERLESLHVPIKRLPGMAELVSGEVRVEELKRVDIEDLLGRDPVPPRPELLARNIEGRVVMVTGAGGSIGSELCRQIVRQNPARLILFELSEFALYAIDQELKALAPQLECLPLLGSVTDYERLFRVIDGFGVQTVFHAAAYKHVPLVEHNPLAGIRNNAFGTDVCAQAAEDGGVDTFVLISTDKAVRPTNVMGATKRLAELCLQTRHARGSRTRFVMVRFGNVLGSSGSVVPLFKKQIAAGGPVTVTHPEITRYFMTIPEAAQLVIQAGAMGEGGDVFVLDMGEPVKIADLARRMVHLSGLTVKDESRPDGDIEIRFSGLRPGEKLYEELLIGDNVLPTDHPRILRAQEYHLDEDVLTGLLQRLRDACLHHDADAAFLLLQQAVHEFQAAERTRDWLAEQAANGVGPAR